MSNITHDGARISPAAAAPAPAASVKAALSRRPTGTSGEGKDLRAGRITLAMASTASIYRIADPRPAERAAPAEIGAGLPEHP